LGVLEFDLSYTLNRMTASKAPTVTMPPNEAMASCGSHLGVVPPSWFLNSFRAWNFIPYSRPYEIVSDSLDSEPDRLAAYSAISHSFQLTAKLSSDLAGRTINGRKKIGIGLLDRDFSERQNFRTDPTMLCRRTVRPDSYINLADTSAESR
jgi:hypothetical protein